MGSGTIPCGGFRENKTDKVPALKELTAWFGMREDKAKEHKVVIKCS